MGVTASIDITDEQHRTILGLLRKHLRDVEVWAYGSRVSWNARSSSDLDIVAFASPAQNRQVSSLRDAFQESSLPFRVDLFVWDEAPQSFRQQIEKEHAVLQKKSDNEPSKADGWPKVSVADIASAVIGGTPSRSVSEYWNGDIPWATAKDVAATPSRYLVQVQEFITEMGLEFSAAKLMPAGAVVITARGTVGALAQLRQDMTINQTCYALIPEDNTDGDFLFYALKGTLSEMQMLTYGTVFETITRRTFENWMIPLPPLPEQRAIAHVLGTLDDKIELNRRMNQTLEEMARALFKSWFVDFDPVRAKMEGRDPGLPPEIAALFPDRLAESELGEIPAGWGVKTLGDVIELAYGKALKANMRRGGQIPVYGSNGQVGWHDEKLVEGPGVIVGRKGNPGLVNWSAADFYPIDTTFYVKAKDNRMSLHFLFHALEGQDLPSIAADSAVPGLNRNLAYMNRQLVPHNRIVEQFDEYASTMFNRSHRLEQESHTLAALRDTLLPKLVSGEVRV